MSAHNLTHFVMRQTSEVDSHLAPAIWLQPATGPGAKHTKGKQVATLLKKTKATASSTRNKSEQSRLMRPWRRNTWIS